MIILEWRWGHWLLIFFSCPFVPFPYHMFPCQDAATLKNIWFHFYIIPDRYAFFLLWNTKEDLLEWCSGKLQIFGEQPLWTLIGCRLYSDCTSIPGFIDPLVVFMRIILLWFYLLKHHCIYWIKLSFKHTVSHVKWTWSRDIKYIKNIKNHVHLTYINWATRT